MESFPRFDRSKLDAREKITSLKEPFVDLFTKLREKIAKGGFDAIVSDDTGARIPTLIFREIYKELTGQYPKALFVASGKSYYPRTDEEKEKLASYIKQGLGESKRVVLITQYIHEGGTVERLTKQLNDLGYKGVTVVALDAMAKEGVLPDGNELYFSKIHSLPQLDMIERHSLLSSVAKNKVYDPKPLRLGDAIETGVLSRESLIYTEEYDDFVEQVPEAQGLSRKEAFDLVVPLINEINKKPLTEDEREAIQKNINFTRELVTEVTKDVVESLRDNKIYQ